MGQQGIRDHIATAVAALSALSAAHEASDAAITAFHAEVFRAGPGPDDESLTQHLLDARTAAARALADGQAAAAVVAKEAAAARNAADAATAEERAVIQRVVPAEGDFRMTLMRASEVEAGKLRDLVRCAPFLQGEAAVIHLEPLHAPLVAAAERSGHQPTLELWAAFIRALKSDADAVFDPDLT